MANHKRDSREVKVTTNNWRLVVDLEAFCWDLLMLGGFGAVSE